MNEHPILFSTPMVQANLENRKTMTRRIIDPQPEVGEYPKTELNGYYWKNKFFVHKCEKKDISFVDNSRYGQPGDLLWVRECFTEWPKGEFQYKASTVPGDELGIWKPSIHMPKAAARIWLQVEEIRVERLQDISDEDAIAEGIEISEGGYYKIYAKDPKNCAWTDSPKVSFMSLFQSINGPEIWFKNPWVWVIKYKVLSTTGKPETRNS